VNGYKIVDSPGKADYIVLSTCAFKKEEEEHSLSRVEALMCYGAKLVVFGCLPDIAPAKFGRYNVSWVSTKNINDIDAHFENIRTRFADVPDVNTIPAKGAYPLKTAVGKFFDEFELSSEYFGKAMGYVGSRLKTIFKDEKRFYLFTSRGCQGECSYCAIKFAIGPIKSKPIDVIIGEYGKGVNEGYRNFVVLGDDVGAYGLDKQSSFPEMLSSLVEASVAHPETGFYIDEIHPKWMVQYQEGLLDIIRSGRVKGIMCPVQSANDRVLALMRRHHDSENMLDLFSKIHIVNPAVQLTTQMLVGFPTETEEEFVDTLHFMKRVRFDYVVIFPYHEKENAPSAKLPGKVPEHVIHERVKIAQDYFNQNGIKAYLSCP
jgi:MiaB/RimO family radical SAM methylthiotransferase